MKKFVLLLAVCLFAGFSANAEDTLAGAAVAVKNAGTAAVATAASAAVAEAPAAPIAGVSDDENWERKKFLVLEDIKALNTQMNAAKKAGTSTADLEKKKSELFKQLEEYDAKIKAAAAQATAK